MSKFNLKLESERLLDYLVNTGMYDLSKVNVQLIHDWLEKQDADLPLKQIKSLLEDYLMSQGLVEVRL